MKYDVLSYDPTESCAEFGWRARARGVSAAKAMETVNALLCCGYDRDVSISVEQVEPELSGGRGLDIDLPGEKQRTLFGDQT